MIRRRNESSRESRQKGRQVSLVIAVYNQSEYLRKALLAARRSQHALHEIIVTDDGSSEDILGLVEQASHGFQCKLTYIRQADRGFRLAKCKNNAIRASSGEYLVFVDQDIVYTDGYLQCFVDHQMEGQFLVAYPIRLSETQSEELTDEMIETGSYARILSSWQIRWVRRQYYLDSWAYYRRKIIGFGHKPKLRGGVFGAFRGDLMRVDGFDENYQGWGNEDDDLGRRLYRIGVCGRTVFYDDFPIHMYHPPYRVQGQRANKPYFRRRLAEIKKGDVKAARGVSAPFGGESLDIVRFDPTDGKTALSS